MSAPPLQSLLLVEDSPGDVRLMQEAFRRVNPRVRLHVASDGVEALGFLKRQGPHADAPRPDLILLDLNMPGINGLGVLAQIKADEFLKSIPTVVLTMSRAEADVAESYRLRTNCYLTKPVELDGFESLVDSINEFWLTQACLPLGTAPR